MIRQVAIAYLSHWRRHPGMLLTLVLGLSLATALWSAVQAINTEARTSYARAAALHTPVDRTVLVMRDGGPIPLTLYTALRRNGWPVSAVLDGRTSLGETRVTVMGVDMVSSPILPGDLENTDAITPAQLLTLPGVVFVGPETAKRVKDIPDGPGPACGSGRSRGYRADRYQPGKRALGSNTVGVASIPFARP